MTVKSFVSATEQKLLLTTILFSFALIFSSVCLLAVESYNAQVAQAQIERKSLAEGGGFSGDFTICTFGATYPEVWSRFFSFLFLPISFLLVRKRRLFLLVTSLILLLLPLFHFWRWFEKTSWRSFYREVAVANWTDNFLYQSNSFDFLLFCLIPLLLIWHVLIACRLFFRSLSNQHFLP